MISYLLRALRWYLIVIFVIAGFYALSLADRYDSVRPVMPAVLCFGVAYVVSFAWRELRKKVLFYSVLSVVGSAFVARYAPYYVFIFTGWAWPMGVHVFVLWAIVVFVFCVPLMTWVFHRHGA